MSVQVEMIADSDNKSPAHWVSLFGTLTGRQSNGSYSVLCNHSGRAVLGRTSVSPTGDDEMLYVDSVNGF